ncbi:MAG: ATP-dependent zinc metalloprotease FtsH [Neisseriaceae bacterium]|nr:ATP-dependent zinc metalloprotease FtsH [Neisseriaceae bacterium]
MGNTFKTLLIWVSLAVILMMSFNALEGDKKSDDTQIEYSAFIQQVRSNQVESVVLESERVMEGYIIKGVRKDENKSKFYTHSPADQKLISTLLDNNVQVKVKPEMRPGFLTSLLYSSLPVLLLIGVWIYFMRQMQNGGGGGRGPFSFGKSRARLLDKESNVITFADVAGCDEAKEEVQEIVDYLKSPSRYQSLGGRVPRGVLLFGSPGTGKTLLAKAIAGEAKVPFFSISGSDFVEMFVGVGASRVRDMFEQAKKNAPCIIFIDEIDAVGRQRGAGLGGGNDEREQTLNQLLVEMDGFESDTTVIVIAATNRPDVLDPALQRPGRFDRQVVVPLPDIRGREQILGVHVKKVQMDESVDLSSLARGTPGFSGADLANLVNEAALLAGRHNKTKVEQSDFEEAKDKIFMGPERRSMIMHEDEKRATAYHESGHAIVAASLPGTDPVHKVTIVPRGRALGLTWQLPERDRISMYQDQILNQISILFGGRIAEELFVKRISTGASNDFERATQLARDMVIKYGMSKKMGPMVYSENEGEVFLGRSVTRTQNMSEETMRQVDQEIRRIVDEQYAIAQRILEDNRDKMETMCQALMDWETIDADQVKEIMAGKQPSPPKDFIKSLMNTLEETVLDTSNTNATPPEVPSSGPSQTGKTE